MQTPSIPPYKPPQEVQEALNRQATQRKRTAQLPKRNWIQRNPRVFQITFITTSLLVLFSRPLYDAFLDASIPSIETPGIAFKKRE